MLRKKIGEFLFCHCLLKVVTLKAILNLLYVSQTAEFLNYTLAVGRKKKHESH